MREIKFKTWDEKNKIMRGPYTLKEISSGMVDIDKIIVRQYINIKDDEDKEVYEGDILDLEVGYTGSYMFEAKVESHCPYCEDFKCTVANPNSVFVGSIIGNKYENPELLRKKK